MEKKNHTYMAHGLKFGSSLEIPEFGAEISGTPDITVDYGEVPEQLSSASSYGIAWQADSERQLFSISEVARYLVVNDTEIIIEPLPGATEDDVRQYFLGPVLGAVLHARKMLVLHASAIKTKKGAVIFMGSSGAGKSTTLATFLKRGYPMLSDDKACIVISKEGHLQVLPGIHTVRLTPETVESLAFETNGSKQSRGIGKYVIPVKEFCNETTPIHKAYALGVHNKNEIVLEPLSPVDLFETFNSNTYRRRFVHNAERRQSHFQILGALSSQTTVTSVLRPENAELIMEVADRIEEDFSE